MFNDTDHRWWWWWWWWYYGTYDDNKGNVLQAHSPEDAEDGMQFMQEMIELSKHQQQEGGSSCADPGMPAISKESNYCIPKCQFGSVNKQ